MRPPHTRVGKGWVSSWVRSLELVSDDDNNGTSHRYFFSAFFPTTIRRMEIVSWYACTRSKRLGRLWKMESKVSKEGGERINLISDSSIWSCTVYLELEVRLASNEKQGRGGDYLNSIPPDKGNQWVVRLIPDQIRSSLPTRETLPSRETTNTQFHPLPYFL